MTELENPGVEPVLQLHKQFLQGILREVMTVLALGSPGVERMIRALHIYWNANFDRRAMRRAVQAGLAGTPYERSIEPLGRPFLIMLQAELQAGMVTDVAALSQKIYDEARAIAVEEALSGQQRMDRRQQLLADIEAASLRKTGKRIERAGPSLTAVMLA